LDNLLLSIPDYHRPHILQQSSGKIYSPLLSEMKIEMMLSKDDLLLPKNLMTAALNYLPWYANYQFNGPEIRLLSHIIATT
jgi:hypothetical protein